MPNIFISYRRADSQYVTDSIYDHMVSHFGESEVFLDVGSIPFGVDFREYLRDQITDHDVILVVIGQDWARIMQERAGQANDFVRIEIENALSMNKLIIPVLVKNAQMPDFSKLPASIGALQWRNSAIIRRQPDLKNDCQRLADGIKQYLQSKEDVDSPETESTSNSDTVDDMPTSPENENLESQVRNALKSALSQSQESAPTTPTPSSESAGASRSTLPTETLSAILPQPFDLIPIPNRDYSIAKYPVTNAQFAQFIGTGGYKNDKWWTPEGLKYRKDENWTEPRYWTDSKWNGASHPVVGVSWFESVAFCLWLSDVTGENIMLPTEDQWQYSAQGDDERAYPWGNEWDCTLCNNSVDPCTSDQTTPVTQYEDKGDSPFGVVDMSGNVWEWCLTDYESKNNTSYDMRALRGGSWYNSLHSNVYRVDGRIRYDPARNFNSWGFRFLLSHTS